MESVSNRDSSKNTCDHVDFEERISIESNLDVFAESTKITSEKSQRGTAV